MCSIEELNIKLLVESEVHYRTYTYNLRLTTVGVDPPAPRASSLDVFVYSMCIQCVFNVFVSCITLLAHGK